MTLRTLADICFALDCRPAFGLSRKKNTVEQRKTKRKGMPAEALSQQQSLPLKQARPAGQVGQRLHRCPTTTLGCRTQRDAPDLHQ